MPRSTLWLGLGLFVVFWIFKDRFPQQWGGFTGLVVVLVVVGFAAMLAGVTVRLAPDPDSGGEPGETS